MNQRDRVWNLIFRVAGSGFFRQMTVQASKVSSEIPLLHFRSHRLHQKNLIVFQASEDASEAPLSYFRPQRIHQTHTYSSGNFVFDVPERTHNVPEQSQNVSARRHNVPERPRTVPEHSRTVAERRRTIPARPWTVTEHLRTSHNRPTTFHRYIFYVLLTNLYTYQRPRNIYISS